MKCKRTKSRRKYPYCVNPSHNIPLCSFNRAWALPAICYHLFKQGSYFISEVSKEATSQNPKCQIKNPLSVTQHSLPWSWQGQNIPKVAPGQASQQKNQILGIKCSCGKKKNTSMKAEHGPWVYFNIRHRLYIHQPPLYLLKRSDLKNLSQSCIMSL